MVVRFHTYCFTARDLNLGDVEDLQRIAGHYDVARMMFTVPSPWPRVSLEAWIRASRWRGVSGFRLGVSERDAYRLIIGVVGLVGDPLRCIFLIEAICRGRG